MLLFMIILTKVYLCYFLIFDVDMYIFGQIDLWWTEPTKVVSYR